MDMKDRNTPILSMKKLIQELEEIQTGYNVLSILERCIIPMEDWSQYAFYSNSESYSINLVYQMDKKFQLLLICWQPGQRDKRHIHIDSESYFKVLEGQICERKYEDSNEGEEIKLNSKTTYEKDKVKKSGRFHSVTNESKESMAVTLHVYIDTSAILTDQDNQFTKSTFVTFTSKYGEPNVPGCVSWDYKHSHTEKLRNIFHRNRYSLRFATTAMSVISFGLALVAMILVLMSNVNDNKRHEITRTSDKKTLFQKLCINCSLIYQLYAESVVSSWKPKLTADQTILNGDQCCAQNENQLSSLFEMILQSNQPNEGTQLSILPDQTLPISVHKTFSQATAQEDDAKHNVRSHTVLNIDPSFNSLVEHARGVDLSSDGLVILFSGLYYVYSNALFQNFQMLQDSTTFYIYVHRVSPGNPSLSGVLLWSRITVDTSVTIKKKSAFIGGVFYLLAGDHIQICLSTPSSTNFDKDFSFIGVIMLSNK